VAEDAQQGARIALEDAEIGGVDQFARDLEVLVDQARQVVTARGSAGLPD
jgi:hypothetical protein